jgi:putative ABC transport system ATP-binding protein
MFGKKNQKEYEYIVQVQDVVKSFKVGDGEVTILKGISFDVKAGEFVSIVGPSGNGKSTLLNMITGIDRPTDGEVVVTGRYLNKMSENQMAAWRGENVGIIFQFFQMLPALSLLQNVILPMDFANKYPVRERRERAMMLLEQVDLVDQAEKLPSMVSGASNNGQPLPGRWPMIRRCWLVTNLPGTWIPGRLTMCLSYSPAWLRGVNLC